jgi:hypothetical protein
MRLFGRLGDSWFVAIAGLLPSSGVESHDHLATSEPT